MTDIKALEARVAELEDQLRAARKEMEDARIAAAGVAVGDIVRAKGRLSGLYRVCAVEPHSWGVWVVANPPRKDGSYGTGRRNLFDNWERVSP